MIEETKVQCYRCKNDFRATDSHINLICKGCQNKEKREKKELIGELLHFIHRRLDSAKTLLEFTERSRNFDLCNTIEDLVDEHMEAQKADCKYYIEKWEQKLREEQK